MHPLATFSTFLSFVVFSSSIKLPSSYKKCAILDKVCLGTNFEAGIRYAAKGLPAYGLVSLDPLLLPELTIGAGKSVVNLQQFYKNVSFTGFSNIKVEDFEVDLDKGILTIKQSYPGFLMNAEYNMMGRILVLPVFGNGHCTVTLGNNALDYSDLGYYSKEDRCCREHDHCSMNLLSGHCERGICNKSPYTRSHCDCDAKFRKCLQNVNSETANTIGVIFFNVIRIFCFKERTPCSEIHGVIPRSKNHKYSCPLAFHPPMYYPVTYFPVLKSIEETKFVK